MLVTTPQSEIDTSRRRVMLSTVHVDPNNMKKSHVDEIKSIFGKIIQIQILETPSYDIVKTTTEVVKKIEEEHTKGNEIIIHITEGRKTMAIAAMYAAYARKNFVKGIFYITEEKNDLVSLPILEFTLSTTKKSILKEYNKGIKNVKELAKITGKTEAMIYSHISSLKEEGYISTDNGLTISGQIMII